MRLVRWLQVHKEARRYADKGVEILYIGHRDHVEAIGTRGVAPELTTIVESVEEAAAVEVNNPNKVAVLTQTTLSVDDTKKFKTLYSLVLRNYKHLARAIFITPLRIVKRLLNKSVPK